VKINYKQLEIKSNVLSAVRLVEIYWPGISGYYLNEDFDLRPD